MFLVCLGRILCCTHIIPFVQTSDVLKRLLTENGDTEYIEWYFRSEESVSNISIFDAGVRIYVVEMYSINARELFCKAYKSGILPPKYLFLTPNWYVEGWWAEGHTSVDYNCTANELAAVALYNVAPVLAEFPEIYDAVAEPNIVSFVLMTSAINKPMPESRMGTGFQGLDQTCFSIV
ncbi:hypothetical protein GBAR_LOCUS31275 [Geodia barretti]|uniref:Uncharacterized protein n=1 Tax=Geodia barretti TaxID=519541 RepID=A0AA35U0S4_GEOBA|nr:hypothetical protein GBAR_LOCUS31275 [Geodia barretti]